MKQESAPNTLSVDEIKKTAGRARLREPFSGISHLVGAAFSIVGLIVLIILGRGRPLHIVSFAIYGTTLIVLYTASTLYHCLSVAKHHTERLMRFDHIAIYLLIAGTYTPVCLVMLGGGWGWSIWGVELGIALTGILITLLWRSAPDWVRVALYICMGWLIVIAAAPMRAHLPGQVLAWLVAGGVTYTIGAAIFALDRPHLWPGKFSAHDLWHLFVLGGSVCHFIMMVRYVMLTDHVV